MKRQLKIKILLLSKNSDLKYDLFRDTDLYKCTEFSKNEDCVLVAADLMIFMEIIEQSLSDCHSFSFTVSPQTELSLALFKKNPFSVSVGFSFYHL